MSSPAPTELQVAGMTCNHCAQRVTDAAQSVPGVRSVSVDARTAHASVRWNPDAEKSVPAVLSAISHAGYAAKEVSPASAQSQPAAWQWNLIVGLGVTGLLMIGEWGFGLGGVPWFQWLAFVLAGVVQVFCGADFYAGAWRQLKAGQSNMDTLVALGSTTAFGYSAWALLAGAGGHVYFMEAAAIISLISFGHWIESRVSERAGSALKSLMQLAPQTARKIVTPDDGQSAQMPSRPFNLKNLKFEVGSGLSTPAPTTEKEVPVAELRVGDRVVLRPGDRVPVDGLVIEGGSAVNEAMLTGESAPVEKKSGSELFAGTVNLNGRLILRVTATGEETALAHIVAAVQRAQTSRAGIQRLGDSISNVFVPVVVCVALAVGCWWGLAPESARHVHELLASVLWHNHLPPTPLAAAFLIAAAVLIIACPCAMGLATPAAIMAAANAAAKRGILIRDGVALEKAGTITAVVFDKTGTLTYGELAVCGPWTPVDSKEAIQEAQQLAGALAKPSSHPVSKVLASFYSDPIELDGWRELPGRGVEAQMGNSQTVRLGSLTWLSECGVTSPATQRLLEKWKSEGATLVGVSKEISLVGVFALLDLPKNNAAKVVSQLKREGLKPYLLTGDNAQTAAAIAGQVGIAPENVFAEVRPEQKADFVKKLQSQSERVAFVGDGINDAPALTQADLGIAVSRASDIAREAADIILLKSGIEAVPEALALARQTLRIIKQNLFWAFFYNALGVPLAALGFISPIFCAAAMGVSDLIVIGNALRLLRGGRK